jgi:biopolymer transport protein TolR
MAFGGQSAPGGSISDINVTPLVDVMLVLLVIFMVTAPILQQGVAIDLPKVAAAPLGGDEEQLVVNVDKSGKVFLNDTVIDLPGLTAKLAAIRAARPDRQVYVRADQAVPYGPVMTTMAAVRESGLTKIGLVTEPPPERRR